MENAFQAQGQARLGSSVHIVWPTIAKIPTARCARTKLAIGATFAGVAPPHSRMEPRLAEEGVSEADASSRVRTGSRNFLPYSRVRKPSGVIVPSGIPGTVGPRGQEAVGLSSKMQTQPDLRPMPASPHVALTLNAGNTTRPTARMPKTRNRTMKRRAREKSQGHWLRPGNTTPPKIAQGLAQS